MIRPSSVTIVVFISLGRAAENNKTNENGLVYKLQHIFIDKYN